MATSSIIRALPLIAATLLTAGCLSQKSAPTSVPGNGGAVAADNGNTAPVIYGSPAQAVMSGDSYSFLPSANDADGDTLSFSISNKPGWAYFDTRTGELSGQTLLGDTGEYRNIVISVTDGKTTTSLRAFSITVTQTALGSMELSWTAPTSNEDGSTLTDLAGYRIYYGESPGDYTESVRIENPSITTYLIENLLPSTYYVVATSFNRSGVESRYSNMAVKNVVAN